MSDQFLGEVRMVSFTFAPKTWALCNGQQLPIAQNQALFSLLNTTFGGNGTTTFALPNCQGRAPLHPGNGFNWGQQGGEAAHTLVVQEMPAHTHPVFGSGNSASSAAPGGTMLGNATGAFYTSAQNLVATSAATISSNGGNQPHNNMQPYLAINFCIALQGVYPSRN